MSVQALDGVVRQDTVTDGTSAGKTVEGNLDQVKPAMMATVSLPSGICLTCCSSGLFLFRRTENSGRDDGEPDLLWAVFSDGSMAVSQGPGTWLLRYPDGSTCEKPVTEKHDENGSMENLLWLSTTADGQHVGQRLQRAQVENTTAEVKEEHCDEVRLAPVA